MEWGKFLLSLFFHLIMSLCTSGRVDGAIAVQKCAGGQELAQRSDCVCNSQVLVEFISEAIRISQSMREKATQIISQRLAAFSCYEFLQLPSHVEIEITDTSPAHLSRRRRKYYTHRKRLRVKRGLISTNSHQHHRTKRQISLGFPTDSKWDEIIPHLPKYGRHYYAPIGTSVSLKCYIGHNDDAQAGIQDQVDDGSREFIWTHANGMEITATYVTIEKTTGDLTFHSVRLADTGIYNCTMKSEDDGVVIDHRTFQSQLDVVAGPTFWLRFGITYTIPRCRHKELLEIQRNIPNLVHKFVCHFCSVRNVSMTCIGFGNGGEGKIVQLTIAMSALGVEELLPSWSHNYVHCNLECQKSIHSKVLQVTSGSLVKLFSLPIHVLQIEGETAVYTSIPESYDEDLTDGCPPGFFLEYSLCFPCPPGTYSPTGPADCFPCLKGFFQPNPGSSACFHCPKGHSTLRKGSRSQMDCILESASFWVQFFNNNFAIVMWVVVGVLILIVLIILIICCWPNSAVGRLLRCVPCCGGNGCCGGGDDSLEKEISEDREMLLTNETSTSDFDSDNDRDEGFNRRSGRKSRVQRYHQDESSDEEDFRTSKASQENVTLSIVRENTSAEKQALKPKPNRLDLTKYASKRPIIPYPFRKGHCQNTLRSLRQQKREELEEQQRQQEEAELAPELPPPLPQSNDDNYYDDQGVNYSETSESSGTKRFHLRNPHLKLGNVLRKSKSLLAKLAEQRHKLRRGQGDSSQKSSKSPSSLSSIKNKIKNKMVKISESRNTFHPPPPPSCKQCSSQVFKKNDSEARESRNKLPSKSSSAILNRFRSQSKERVKNCVKKIQNKVDKRWKRR